MKHPELPFRVGVERGHLRRLRHGVQRLELLQVVHVFHALGQERRRVCFAPADVVVAVANIRHEGETPVEVPRDGEEDVSLEARDGEDERLDGVAGVSVAREALAHAVDVHRSVVHEPIEGFIAAIGLLRRLAQVHEGAFGARECLGMDDVRIGVRVHRVFASRAAEEREHVHAPPVRGADIILLLRQLPSFVAVVQQVSVRHASEALASRELVLPAFEQVLARLEEGVAPHVRGDEGAQPIAQLPDPLLLLPARRQRLWMGESKKGTGAVRLKIGGCERAGDWKRLRDGTHRHVRRERLYPGIELLPERLHGDGDLAHVAPWANAVRGRASPPLPRPRVCGNARGTAKVKRKVPSLPPARCQIGPLLCESPLGSIPPGRQRLPRVTGGRGEAPHRDREGHDCTREVTRGESRWRTHTTVRPRPPPFPPLAPHGRIFTPRECPSRIREFPPAPTTPHPPDPHLR